MAVRLTVDENDLASRLEIACHHYYNETPIVSDEEFDKAKRQLQEANPNHPFLKRVGAPVPGTAKVKHAIPMGSQANALNREDFDKWLKRINAKGQQINMTQKMDGSSLELVYENGIFVQAITRGDGKIGEDVTRNIVQSTSVPRKIDPAIESVRGEAVLHLKDFESFFKDEMANARNAAAGLVRRHSGSGAKFLMFYAFDVVTRTPMSTETAVLSFLKANKFKIPKFGTFVDAENMWEWYQQQENDRDSLPYEIDGVVAKLDDRKRSEELGVASGCPKGQIAIKFKSRGAETTLKNVVWQVGHTGRVNPVAELTPVGVGGTVIQRATLNNPDEINRLGIAIGDMVEVVRAADVIPKITQLVRKSSSRKKIKLPTRCPKCNASVLRDGAYLICTNEKCEGKKFKKIETWIKKRNIMHIGSGILEALHEAGRISSIRDLYQLSVFDWQDLDVGNGKLGSTRAEKIMDSLDLSRYLTAADFFGCLGVPSVGRSLVDQMCRAFNIQSDYKEVFSITPEQLSTVEGFGKERANAFINWIDEHHDEITDLGTCMIFQTPKYGKDSAGKLADKTICFTGKCNLPRKELQDKAKQAGAKCVSSVSQGTDYLVIADPSSGSSKAQKARKYGTSLISEEEFLQMI